MSPSDLILSISGARGIVGEGLTPPIAARFGAALGSWLRETTGAEAPRVVVGRDSRRSGEMLEMAAVSGLLGVGCRVIRLGIATTPGTAIITDTLEADGGLIVTASHNPAPWNGLKPLRRGGSAPPAHEAEQLIKHFHEGHHAYQPADRLHPIEQRLDTDRIHAQRIARCVDVDAIQGSGLTVAVDSIHGAGGRETLALLEALGVSAKHRYQFHPEPTGRFPRTPEPTMDNLAAFCDEVRAFEPDVTFVQDPDADRLAIIDEQCRCIGEEYTLALCAMHRLQKGDVTVANLSTSRMIDDIAQQAGATVIRTSVGEANVAAAMREHHAAVGGEGNGGVILPEVSFVRDSLVGIALVLEMLARRKQPLSEIVQQLPAYAIVKDKAPADGELTRQLSQILTNRYSEQTIDQQDGVRIDWPDRWVHVRPSNTEPIVRLIAEAPDAQKADSLLNEVKESLGIAVA